MFWQMEISFDGNELAKEDHENDGYSIYEVDMKKRDCQSKIFICLKYTNFPPDQGVIGDKSDNKLGLSNAKLRASLIFSSHD